MYVFSLELAALPRYNTGTNSASAALLLAIDKPFRRVWII